MEMVNKIEKLTILKGALIALLLGPIGAGAATVGELERRIERLERALEQAQEERKEIVKQVEEVPAAKQDDVNVSLYGRFWPRVTYRDEDSSSLDITDALSRVGIKADSKVYDGLTAVLHGEWDVDIEDDSRFADARLAYTGLKSDNWGTILIGQQWDPHFNITAEVTDIYYHRNSPFGYDEGPGPFRTDNLIRYAHSVGAWKWDIGIQVNGNADGGNGGGTNNNRAPEGSSDTSFTAGTTTTTTIGFEEEDNVDAASIGVGYDFGNAYLGISYLVQSLHDFRITRAVTPSGGPTTTTIARDDVERTYLGIGGSWKPYDGLYLAFTYQDIESEQIRGSDLDQDTIDLLASWDLGNDYNLITGYFSHDDDDQGNEVDGLNVTLIKKLNDNSKWFAEWVNFSFDEDRASGEDDINTFSLGFRYDFNALLF